MFLPWYNAVRARGRLQRQPSDASRTEVGALLVPPYRPPPEFIKGKPRALGLLFIYKQRRGWAHGICSKTEVSCLVFMSTATVSRPFGFSPDSASSCQFGGMLAVHVLQSSNTWLLSSYISLSLSPLGVKFPRPQILPTV